MNSGPKSMPSASAGQVTTLPCPIADKGTVMSSPSVTNMCSTSVCFLASSNQTFTCSSCTLDYAGTKQLGVSRFCWTAIMCLNMVCHIHHDPFEQGDSVCTSFGPLHLSMPRAGEKTSYPRLSRHNKFAMCLPAGPSAGLMVWQTSKP